MERLADIHEESLVTIDSEVCGGAPVVRGTRIPIHTLAALAEQGAPDEELLEDYPSLTAESLAAALEYARAHPRRNQPERASRVHETLVGPAN
jgi:uncharacterized protein (DUF433 family)